MYVTCCFSFITSEISQLTGQYRYQFVGEIMTDFLTTKEIVRPATLGIPKGMRNAVSISIAFSVEILTRNETQTQSKKTFKIILH